jgi:hypothetical protein
MFPTAGRAVSFKPSLDANKRHFLVPAEDFALAPRGAHVKTTGMPHRHESIRAHRTRRAALTLAIGSLGYPPLLLFGWRLTNRFKLRRGR